MASNIKAKNKIYKFKTFGGMPYSNVGHIDYGSGNQYINSPALNNTFTQLEENDAYAAQYLKNKLIAQIGPSIVDPSNLYAEAEAMPNGTKFFINGNGATIFWKKECSLDESLFQIDEKFGLDSISLVQKVGDGIAVVGSSKGAFLISASQLGSEPFNPLETEAKDSYGNHVRLTSASRGDYAQKLFGAEVDGVKGLWTLKQNPTTEEWYFSKVSGVANIRDDIIDISYRASDNRALIATEMNLYTCKLVNDTAEQFKNIYGVNGVTSPGHICKAVMLEDDAEEYQQFSGTLLLFMSDGSILKSSKASDVFLDPLWYVMSDDGIRVNDKIEYKGDTYYATSKGLMKIDPVTGHLMCVGCFFDESAEDEDEQVDYGDDAPDPESEIKHISIYDDTMVYGNAKGQMLCCNGGIYVHPLYSRCSNSYCLSSPIKDLFFYNDVRFVATESALMYERVDDICCAFVPVADEMLSCIDFMHMFSQSSCYMYATTSADEDTYGMASISVAEPFINETPEILGLSPMLSSQLFEGKCYYVQCSFALNGQTSAAYAVVNYADQLSDLQKSPLSTFVSNEDDDDSYQEETYGSSASFKVIRLSDGASIYDPLQDVNLHDIARGVLVSDRYVYINGMNYLYAFEIEEDGNISPPFGDQLPVGLEQQCDIVEWSSIEGYDGYYAAIVSGYNKYIDDQKNVTMSNVWKFSTLQVQNADDNDDNMFSINELSSFETSCRSDIFKYNNTYTIMQMPNGATELSDAKLNTYRYFNGLQSIDFNDEDAFIGMPETTSYVALSDLYKNILFGITNIARNQPLSSNYQIINNGEIKYDGYDLYYRSDLIVSSSKKNNSWYYRQMAYSPEKLYQLYSISSINSIIGRNEEGEFFVKSSIVSSLQKYDETNNSQINPVKIAMPDNNQYAAAILDNIDIDGDIISSKKEKQSISLIYYRDSFDENNNSFIKKRLTNFNMFLSGLNNRFSLSDYIPSNSNAPGRSTAYTLDDVEILKIHDDENIEFDDNNQISSVYNKIDLIYSYHTCPKYLKRDIFYSHNIFTDDYNRHYSISSYLLSIQFSLKTYIDGEEIKNSIIELIPEDAVCILSTENNDLYLSSNNIFLSEKYKYQSFVHINDNLTYFSYNNSIYRLYYDDNDILHFDNEPYVEFDSNSAIYSMQCINSYEISSEEDESDDNVDDDISEDNISKDEYVSEDRIPWDQAITSFPILSTLNTNEYLTCNTSKSLQILVSSDNNIFDLSTIQLSSNGDFYFDDNQHISANTIIFNRMYIDIKPEKSLKYVDGHGWYIPRSFGLIDMFTTNVNNNAEYNDRYHLNVFRSANTDGSDTLFQTSPYVAYNEIEDVIKNIAYLLPGICPFYDTSTIQNIYQSNWLSYDKNISSIAWIGTRYYDDDQDDNLNIVHINQDQSYNLISIDNFSLGTNDIRPISCQMPNDYEDPIAFTYISTDNDEASVIVQHGEKVFDKYIIDDALCCIYEEENLDPSYLQVLNTYGTRGFAYPMYSIVSDDVHMMDYKTELCIVSNIDTRELDGVPYGSILSTSNSPYAYAQVSSGEYCKLCCFNDWTEHDKMACKRAVYPDRDIRRFGESTSVLIHTNDDTWKISCANGAMSQISPADFASYALSSMDITLMDSVPTNTTYYKLYAANDDGSFTFQFNGSEPSGYTFTDSGVEVSGEVHTVIDNGVNEFIVGDESAIYDCQFYDEGGLVFPMSEDGDGEYSALARYDGVDGTRYTVAKKNEILSSTDLQLWQSMLSVGEDEDARIDSFLQLDPYSVIATTKQEDEPDGLYCSKYTIALVNDTSEFTAQSAYEVYDSLKGDIETSCDEMLKTHIDQQHTPEGTSINTLNKYMDTSFSIPDGFTLCSDAPYSAENDYIERMFIGDASDGKIVAQARNSYMEGENAKAIDCKYIAKCWKSGIVEFYIYLPTTYTYYIPHVPGASYCTAEDTMVEVNGKSISPSVAENATSVQVQILSSWFYMEDVLENTIKGNSLPLKVHKEDKNYLQYEGQAADLWHSFVQPSIAKKIDTSTTYSEYYKADYCCFGSDAQAIKIVAYDPRKNYTKSTRTLVLNGNGGTVAGTALSTMTYILLEGDGPKTVKFDTFEKDGGLFLGWTINPTKTVPDDGYTSDFNVSYDDLSSTSTLNLYACWTMYQFGPDDTQLTFNSDEKQTYTIAEIGIDKNADPGNGNANLDNKLIINFGDE